MTNVKNFYDLIINTGFLQGVSTRSCDTIKYSMTVKIKRVWGGGGVMGH